jgi:golgi-specific brefeldin A-resistance guanine nucleotide exchange factor 1
MAERIEKPSLSPAWPSTHPSPNALAVTKERKRILLAGAAHFNQKPKLGLAYLEEHGLLPSEPGPERSEAIARMLRTSPKLDKRLLGDYLSRPANAEILTAFMKMFHFKDVSGRTGQRQVDRD